MQETSAQTAPGLSTKYMILKLGHDHMHSCMRIELSVIQVQQPSPRDTASTDTWWSAFIYNDRDNRMVDPHSFPMRFHVASWTVRDPERGQGQNVVDLPLQDQPKDEIH